MRSEKDYQPSGTGGNASNLNNLHDCPDYGMIILIGTGMIVYHWLASKRKEN